MDSFENIDALYDDGKYSEIYKELSKRPDKDSNADVLWRLARVCYQMATPLEPKNPKKKSLLDEGHQYALAAKQLKPDEFIVLKWLAALTGSRTDFLGTEEKIEQGNVFKALLSRCLSVHPKDYALLHMHGRFCFSMAGLPWERKPAAVYSREQLLKYATSPYSTLPPKNMNQIVLQMSDIVGKFPRKFIYYS